MAWIKDTVSVIFAVSMDTQNHPEMAQQVAAALQSANDWARSHNQNENRTFQLRTHIVMSRPFAKWGMLGGLDSVGGRSRLCEDHAGALSEKLLELLAYEKYARAKGVCIFFLTDGKHAAELADCLKNGAGEEQAEADKMVFALGAAAKSEDIAALAGDRRSVLRVDEGQDLQAVLLPALKAWTDALCDPCPNTEVPEAAHQLHMPNCDTFISYTNENVAAEREMLSSILDNLSSDWVCERVEPEYKMHSRFLGETHPETVKAKQKTAQAYRNAAVQRKIPKPTLREVEFSAVVPQGITKGEYGMIEIALYEPHHRHIVDKLIENAEGPTREVIAGGQEIADGTQVTIRLTSPEPELPDCQETQRWRGKYLLFSFPVELPRSYAKQQVLFVATVYFDDVIATRLKFTVRCSTALEKKLQLTREDVLSAFISYASEDRARVATIIQGMKKARPDMDIFFDVDNLRSGTNWEETLMDEIASRDILYLCWSNYAKASQWVEKEWRYALQNKGLEAIEPVPLVSPKECPPPEELKSKHFNDRALLYIR